MNQYFTILGCFFLMGSERLSNGTEFTPVTFTFKEYQYKDSPKNEMTFREFESACEQSNACSHLAGMGRTRCVRECVSPSCYKELYQADPIFYCKNAGHRSSILQEIIKTRLNNRNVFDQK